MTGRPSGLGACRSGLASRRPVRPFQALCGLAGLVALTLPPLACAESKPESKPRWEIGLGVGTARVPDYRGSDEHGNYTLPFPYLVYRGDILKADKDGLRTKVFGLEGLRMDFTMGLSNPVSNSDNRARAGMPDRPWVVELGPALDARLFVSDDERTRLRFRLPVSYGIAIGQDGGGNGWQAAPRLVLDVRDVLGAKGWHWNLLGGPIFATRQRHAWYYDVAPVYARPDRPAYSAKGGYSGTTLVTGLTTRIDRMWVGGFVRYDSLQGAAFADSPLVKTRHYGAIGIAFSWVLWESSEMVEQE